MKVKIADNLSFPIDIVTQTIAILAKRRAGKSYLARKLAEQVFQAGQQIVVIDPKGDWHGIRSSSDGRGPGLPIIILGGEHGDISKIETSSGEVVAKMIVEELVSVLIDLSFFRKHEVATFMTGLLENLYRLKAKEQYRTPVMLLIDEADAIAPQKPQKGEERMLGAAEDIVRRGGQRGIGCCLVTQRSAVLNKNVLTQTQILIVLRTIAPQDLAAMEAWIDVHGTQEERNILMESLPAMPVGDAWVWSPGWPSIDGIFKRVHILPIDTFDSGATPEPGKKTSTPKHMADVDLDALKRQMAATIERAKADDPRELRKKISELEKQVSEKPKIEKTVPLLTDDQERRLIEFHEILLDVRRGHEEIIKSIEHDETVFLKIINDFGLFRSEIIKSKNTPLPKPYFPSVPVKLRPTPVASGNVGGNEIGSGGLRRMMIALAQRPQGLSAQQMGVRAGLSSKSGTFNTYLTRARSSGWIEGSKNQLKITEAGISVLGEWDPLPTGSDLLQYWLSQLGGSGASRMLESLAGAYPRAMTKEEVADAAGMTISGTFNTYLTRLRSLELVEGRGELRASEELF